MRLDQLSDYEDTAEHCRGDWGTLSMFVCHGYTEDWIIILAQCHTISISTILASYHVHNNSVILTVQQGEVEMLKTSFSTSQHWFTNHILTSQGHQSVEEGRKREWMTNFYQLESHKPTNIAGDFCSQNSIQPLVKRDSIQIKQIQPSQKVLKISWTTNIIPSWNLISHSKR